MLNDDVLFEIFSLLDCSPSNFYIKQVFTPLRLVNKAFCEAASPYLFRTVCLIPWCFSIPESVERLHDMSSSPLAGYFKTLTMCGPTSTSVSCRIFLEDLATLLPICMARFPALRAISILSFPNPPLTESLQLQFDNCILNALRSAPLPNLKSLHFEFFAAADFRQLLMACPGTRSLSRLMSRLQHLSVSFVDPTFRDRSFTYPNPRDEGNIFPFFRLATNLRSLKIKSVHIFDLDNLGQLNLQKLDSLELHGVDVKSHTLLSLLSPLQTSPRHLVLQGVKLRDGTWKIIFQHLHNFPTILFLDICYVGYSLNGESRRYSLDLMPEALRGVSDLTLQSVYSPDHVSLDLLKEAVEKRRKEARLHLLW